MTINPRAHELTATINREKFDELPGAVTAEADRVRWEMFRAEYHKAQQLESNAPFPLQIDFELNSTCQLACKFCLHGVSNVEKRVMAFDDFARVIKEGERWGLCSIKLNYINEPLLNRDLPAFIEYARAHGIINTYFATNGVLLSPSVAQRLIDAKLSKIMISLDATTPETFQRIRNSDKYDLIVRNILALIKLRDSQNLTYPLVRVNFLQTKGNRHEADDFIRRWSNVADMIGFQRQVQLPGIESDLIELDPSPSPGGFRCSFPFKMVVVDSAGDILPCCTFSGRLMPLGNIKSTTIKEAWDSHQMNQLKYTHLNGGYRHNDVCRHCIGGHDA